MSNELFTFHHDENQIWHFRFNDGTRDAIKLYIATITDLNQKIANGEIKTRNPICVLWDFKNGILPGLEKIVLRSRLDPPPKSLAFRIAFLFETRQILLKLQAYQAHLNHDKVERAYFLYTQREQALEWLIASSTLSQA